MYDSIDIIKNLKTISENNNAFKVIKDFERVMDELDIYVFKNWIDGELLEGPNVSRYKVTCKFVWPKDLMPDPEGGLRLTDYGCSVKYGESHILYPRKIRDPEDFRPGTKKGKIDAHPVWIVEISMPKQLIHDVEVGKNNQIHNKMAELMKYNKNDLTPDAAAQETPEDETAT